MKEKHAAATFTVATYTYVRDGIKCDFCQHGKDTDKDDGNYQQAHVTVADMT